MKEFEGVQEKLSRATEGLAELENEVASLMSTRDELVDVVRKLRKRRAKLEFVATAQRVVPNVVAVGEQ